MYEVYPIYDDLKIKFNVNSSLEISGYNAVKFLFLNKELIRSIRNLFKDNKEPFYNKKLNKVSI